MYSGFVGNTLGLSEENKSECAIFFMDIGGTANSAARAFSSGVATFRVDGASGDSTETSAEVRELGDGHDGRRQAEWIRDISGIRIKADSRGDTFALEDGE